MAISSIVPVVRSSVAFLAPTMRLEVLDNVPHFAEVFACVLPSTTSVVPVAVLLHAMLCQPPVTTLEVPFRLMLPDEPRKWQKACPFPRTSIFQSPPEVL